MDDLGKLRLQHKEILVSFSGGKDSLCVLDLALRTFEKTECFFMYLVPGLEVVENALDFARKRWGVTIRQYPHWVLSNCLRTGAYCFERDVPEWKLKDVWEVARSEAKVELVAVGAKASDSMWRRRNLTVQSRTNLSYPLEKWTKLDVLSYLKSRQIPVPTSSGKQATGIDLSTPSLLWLHDKHPSDFKKICEKFPYAEAVVWRRKFHGVGERFA